MENWEKEWIDKHEKELYAMTDIGHPLLIILKQNKVLTDANIKELERRRHHLENGHSAAKMDFYNFLKEKVGGYQILINALKQELQSGVVKILEDGQKQHENEAGGAEISGPQPVVAGQQQPSVSGQQHPSSLGVKISDKLTVDKDIDVKIKEQLDFRKEAYPFSVTVTDDTNLEVPLPCFYEETTNGKRIFLLANITEFPSDPTLNREGADVDSNNMTKLWEGLRWEVVNVGEPTKAHPYGGYITKDDLMRAIEKLKERCASQWVDAIVVYLSSHGTHDWIYTSDDEFVNIHADIMYKFGHENCDDLKGKPKIFFQNSCAVFSKTAAHPNCGPKVGILEDAMLVRPQIPGGYSHRNTRKGSHFAVTLTLVLMHLAWKHNFAELMEIVYHYMGCIKANFDKDYPQRPAIEPFSIKDFTLFPKRK